MNWHTWKKIWYAGRGYQLDWRILFVLAVLCVAVAAHCAEYNRAEWKLWVDEDHDGQNTRDEVLIDEALPGSVVLSADGHRVVYGVWVDPYSGQTLSGDPKQLDIDHVVPLGYVAAHGGQSWSPERKEQYANDLSNPDHLAAVLARLNRQKGAKGPDQWVPPLASSHCWYGRAWARVVSKWDLTLSNAEWASIGAMLVECH